MSGTTNTTGFSYQFTPEPPGPLLRDQLIKLVTGRRDASERYFKPFRTKLPRYYDLWRGYYTGHFTPTKNNVTIPLIFSTILSDVARKIATAFSQWPIVGFSGFGPDDQTVARKQEALVNAQMRDADTVSKELVTFLGADLYGTAVSQVMWDHKEETANLTNVIRSPISSDIVRTREKRQVVTFDGPNYRNIDLLDFYPQPGFREINGNQGMQWCEVRYYLDLDQCRFLASEEGGKVFDLAEINRLVSDDSNPKFHQDDQLQRRFEARQGISPHQLMEDPHSRPIELIEMWGTIPSEFRGHFGGSTNVVITVANDQYLFRSVDTPMDHRLKPFIKYSPTPDPHYFYAPGKAEIAAQLQIAGNRFINHQLDAADLLVHPMFIYNRMKNVNTRNLVAMPGKLFGVDGPPQDALQPLQMDFKGLQVGGAMTDTMWRFIQMGSGVQEDTIMGGAGGSDRQTAREFIGRREASGTRLMLESVLYDSAYLEPLAGMMISLNQQFLELPREVLILGDSAIIDPVTGAPIKETRLEIDETVLNRQYAVRALGSTMGLSKETEKANLMTIMQIVASGGDAFAGAFNMVAFLRQILIAFGFSNVNELIQKQPQVAELLERQGTTAAQVPTDAGGLAEFMGGGAPSGPTSGIQGLL